MTATHGGDSQDQPSVRDWGLRFNAQGPEGLIDRKAPGQAPKLNAAQRQALAKKVGRELKGMGFRKLSARPRHYAKNGEAIEDFKKTSPPRWQRSGQPCRQEPT